MIIRTLGKLIALLNSNSRPGEIGAGIAYGFVLAVVPANNLLWLALFVLAFLVKINLGLTLVFSLLFSLLTPFVDPLVDSLGVLILSSPLLEELLAALYAVDPMPWTRFNHALVTGGLVSGLLLFVPLTVTSALLVRLYRRHVHDRIINSKLVKAFTKLPIVQKIGAAAVQARRLWPGAA